MLRCLKKGANSIDALDSRHFHLRCKVLHTALVTKREVSPPFFAENSDGRKLASQARKSVLAPSPASNYFLFRVMCGISVIGKKVARLEAWEPHHFKNEKGDPRERASSWRVALT